MFRFAGISHESPQLPASLHKPLIEQTLQIFTASGPLGFSWSVNISLKAQLFLNKQNQTEKRVGLDVVDLWRCESYWLGVSVERLYDLVDNTPVAMHNEQKNSAKRQKAELVQMPTT